MHGACLSKLELLRIARGKVLKLIGFIEIHDFYGVSTKVEHLLLRFVFSGPRKALRILCRLSLCNSEFKFFQRI